jgi:hypothetical protein
MWLAALIALAALASGCQKVWSARAVQPPPLLGVSLEARTSLPATFTTHDMELPSWINLDNSAYFVVVSKDRLRVHVSLRHKAADLTDPRRWRVTMVDSLGRRLTPQGVDRRALRPITSMYQRGHDGASDLPLYAVTFWHGDGDYTFYRTGLYRRDVRWIMLIMARPGYEYRYLWTFVDDPAADDRPAEVTARHLPARR